MYLATISEGLSKSRPNFPFVWMFLKKPCLLGDSASAVLQMLSPALHHARLPCPPPSLGVCSNSLPLTRWCHPTTSSSVTPFSSGLQSFPALESFPVIRFFTSGGQIIGASASASVLPMNIQDWFPLGWTGLISLWSEGLSRVFSSTTVQKHLFFWHSVFFMVQLPHCYMTTAETIALTRWTFVGKITSLLFNILSRFVIAFLPKSKCLLISWLQSPSAVVLEPKKMKTVTVCTFSPSICHEMMGPDAMMFTFWVLSFKPPFSLSSSPPHQQAL